jgi:prophage antirepressor-like protein
MSNLKNLPNPFLFESSDIRTAVDENNDIWFCAKDVCAVLDISWSSMTLENMPESWKLVIKLITSFGEKDTYFVNEAGLYHLIFRSNKPKAKEFASWVCAEVLPQIRKLGYFGALPAKQYIAVIKQIDYLTHALVSSKNVFHIRTMLDQLRTLHNMVGSKMPDMQLVKADIEQSDLFIGIDGGVK